MIGRTISCMAYIWLITSEAFDELFHLAIGDSLRHFFSTPAPRSLEAPGVHTERHPEEKTRNIGTALVRQACWHLPHSYSNKSITYKRKGVIFDGLATFRNNNCTHSFLKSFCRPNSVLHHEPDHL